MEPEDSTVQNLITESGSLINDISEAAPNARAYPRLCRLLFLACNRHALYCSMWREVQVKLPVVALKRLAHVLAQVKEFVRQCSDEEHWEWIAASRYDRRWEVVEFLSELQECVDVINSEAIRRTSQQQFAEEGTWVSRALERLSDIERDQLDLYDLPSLADEDCGELVKNASSKELVEYLSHRQRGFCPRIDLEEGPAAPTEGFTGNYSNIRLRPSWLGQPAMLVKVDFDEDVKVTNGPFPGPHSSIVQIFGWCHYVGKRYILTERRQRHSHNLSEPLTVFRLLEVTYQVVQAVLHLHRNGFQEAEVDLRLYDTLVFMVYWWRQESWNATRLKSLLSGSLNLFVKLAEARYGEENAEALTEIMNQSEYDTPDMDVIIDILQGFRRHHSRMEAAPEWRQTKLIPYSKAHRYEGGLFSCRIVLRSSDVLPAQFENLPKRVAELSALRHPHILQYYASEAAVKAKDYPWSVDYVLVIYEEGVPGFRLLKHLTKSPGLFNEDAVRKYTCQILSGLVYLHSTDTIHGALTATNILVDTTAEVVKLAHYGLPVKPIEVVLRMPAEFYGSVSADVWSLGCAVLEMIEALHPSKYSNMLSNFFGRGLVEVGSGEETPEIPGSSFLVECNHFLRLCFEREAGNRRTAAQLLDHPFVLGYLSKPTMKSEAHDTSTEDSDVPRLKPSPGPSSSMQPSREASKF